MTGAVSCHVVSARAFPASRISVGSTEHQQDFLSLPDCRAADIGRAGAGPNEMLNRAFEPYGFLECGACQTGFVPQPLELLWEPRKTVERGAKASHCRIQTR